MDRWQVCIANVATSLHQRRGRMRVALGPKSYRRTLAAAVPLSLARILSPAIMPTSEVHFDPDPSCPTADEIHGGYRQHRRWKVWRRCLLELSVGTGIAFLTVYLRSLNHRSPLGSGNAMLTASVCMVLLILGLTGIEWQCSRNPHAVPLRKIPEAFGIAALVCFAALFFMRDFGNHVSRPTVGVYTLLAAATLMALHAITAHQLRQGRPVVHVIAVGPQTRIDPLVQKLRASRDFDVEPMYCDGFVDENSVHSKLDALYGAVRQHTADELLLTMQAGGTTPEQSRFYQGVLDLCEEMGVHLRLWTDWLPSHSHVYLDYLGESPVLTFAYSRATYGGLALKRTFDMILGSILLVVSLPIIGMASLAIRWDSPGPALFRQPRCGLRGRPFSILKLRTMQDGAAKLETGLRAENNLSGPAFKMDADPRITRVGRFLRRTSIDELPQLWNVVRGQMSLVGPRPAPTTEVDLYPPEYFRKLAMKPGITGLWQVSGRTKIVDFEHRIALDTDYIRNWSLGQDAVILLKTLAVVLRCTGV